MEDQFDNEPLDGDDGREPAPDALAPVVPDELINGDWRRRLVLPDQDGQLRLTPVRTVRNGRPEPSSNIRYLDEKRRHSA